MNDEMNIGELLADQVDKLFSREVTRERLIAVEQGRFDTGLWQNLDDMGICLALAPESAGGVGLTWQEAEPALRIAGSWAAPVPLAETMVAAWAMGHAGMDLPGAPMAVAGEVFQLGENSPDSGVRVSGASAVTPWITVCDHLLVLARNDRESRLCLLHRHDITVEDIETIARLPGGRIDVANAEPLASAVLPNTLSSALGELGLLPLLACVRTVQMAGLIDRLLELCVDYGNTREQFGRPIGRFQAIQHMIADLAGQSAAARVAGLYACRQIDKGAIEQGATVAKARIGPAATRGAEIAHQVFGAIGFTDEHILHYYSRRLWQWRSEAGSEHWWAERLGQQVLARGGSALWPSITDPKPTTVE